MNGQDRQWIESLLSQHKEDQERYLDAKFDNVKADINEIKSAIKDIRKIHEEDIDKCAKCKIELESKISNVELDSIERIGALSKDTTKHYLHIGMISAGIGVIIGIIMEFYKIDIIGTIIKLIPALR